MNEIQVIKNSFDSREIYV